MVPCGLALVRDDVGELDPAVPARCGALEGNSTRFQELDEGGAADAEEVRGLLGRQQLVDGCDGDRSALRHSANDVNERAVRLHREADGLAVRPDKHGRLSHPLQEVGQVEHGFEVLGGQGRRVHRCGRRAHGTTVTEESKKLKPCAGAGSPVVLV